MKPLALLIVALMLAIGLAAVVLGGLLGFLADRFCDALDEL